MILEQPQELTIKLKKELKHSFKKYFIVVLIQSVLVFGGGLIFLYIEQCYHKTSSKGPPQQTVTMDTNYGMLCKGLHHHLNLTSHREDVSDAKNGDHFNYYKVVLQGKFDRKKISHRIPKDFQIL